MKKLLAAVTHPLVLGLLLAASGFLLGALLGCSKAPPDSVVIRDSFNTSSSPAARRATALELLEAAKGTNEPPGWFNEQERAAVQKLRLP